MTIFNARDYWPQPKPGETLTNTFSSGIVQHYTIDLNGGVRLRQYINGNWDCDWFYRIDRNGDVLEYRDDYPRKWYNLPWKYAREVVCVPGKEIYWGGFNQPIGVPVGRQCVTSGLFGQWGLQELDFEAILPEFSTPCGTFQDVLVLTYWQQWGDGKIDGARMWLAPGLGQIRAEWMLNRKPTGYFMELLKTELRWG
jgi:hypothetical protein